MKRTCSLILTVCLFVSLLSTFSFASPGKEAQKFIKIANALSTSDSTTVSAVKTVPDFAGNMYTVVEHSPTGYYIFHNETGNFVEYAEGAVSPYYGYYEDIFYGGPTEYYVKEGNVYYHTVLDYKQLTASDIADVVTISNEWNNHVVEIARQNASTVQPNYEISDYANSYIPGGEAFFKGNYNFGYIPNGYCGYIAASMVLQFHDQRGNINIPISSNRANFTKEIVRGYLGNDHDFNQGGPTMPGDVCGALDAYCDSHNVAGTSNWSAGLLSADNELSNGRPVILMGRYADTTDWHAVVAYGKQVHIWSGTINYIVHYGWTDTGFDHVVLVGTTTANVRFSV